MRHLPGAAVIVDSAGDYSLCPFRQGLGDVVGPRVKKNQRYVSGFVRTDDAVREPLHRRRIMPVDRHFERCERSDRGLRNFGSKAAIDDAMRMSKQNVDNARARYFLDERREARTDAFQRGYVGKKRI